MDMLIEGEVSLAFLASNYLGKEMAGGRPFMILGVWWKIRNDIDIYWLRSLTLIQLWKKYSHMWKSGVRVDPDNDSCQTLFKCMARYINVFKHFIWLIGSQKIANENEQYANNGLSDAAIFLRPGSARTPKNWMRVKGIREIMHLVASLCPSIVC